MSRAAHGCASGTRAARSSAWASAAPKDSDDESAGAASAEAAKKGVETVRKLKGLFGG